MIEHDKEWTGYVSPHEDFYGKLCWTSAGGFTKPLDDMSEGYLVNVLLLLHRQVDGLKALRYRAEMAIYARTFEHVIKRKERSLRLVAAHLDAKIELQETDE